MAKTCKKEGCNNPVFSTGFCNSHQYLRTDDKWLNKKTIKTIKNAILFLNSNKNKQQVRNSIKRKPKEATGQKILFDTLLSVREHKSYISGQIIEAVDGCINHNNMAHVLSK
jgi:hypothetical protein